MPKILQLKITLQGSEKPPIWRMVQIPTNINFQQLHAIIQEAMGWMNAHLHQFHLGRQTPFFIGIPDPYDDSGETKDGRKVKINEYLTKEKDQIYYEYDFGDGWAHSIQVQEVLEAKTGIVYPHLLKGKGACPPEDCGGIWGYNNLVEAINDPDHEEHEDLCEWMDTDYWDANEFDLEDHRENVVSGFKNAAAYYG